MLVMMALDHIDVIYDCDDNDGVIMMMLPIMMMMSIMMSIVFAMALNSMMQASLNCRKLERGSRESEESG